MQPQGFPAFPGINPEDIVRGILALITGVLLLFGAIGMPEGSSLHSKDTVVVTKVNVKEPISKTRQRLYDVIQADRGVFSDVSSDLQSEAQKFADRAARYDSFDNAPNKGYVLISRKNKADLTANDFVNDLKAAPAFADNSRTEAGVGVARSDTTTYVVVILRPISGEPTEDENTAALVS